MTKLIIEKVGRSGQQLSLRRGGRCMVPPRLRLGKTMFRREAEGHHSRVTQRSWERDLARARPTRRLGAGCPRRGDRARVKRGPGGAYG